MSIILKMLFAAIDIDLSSGNDVCIRKLSNNTFIMLHRIPQPMTNATRYEYVSAFHVPSVKAVWYKNRSTIFT